jgi:AraC-like DNA-binding protein
MGDSTVESVVGLPAPALRPLVGRYVGYRVEGSAPRLHRGLPSRHVTLIISLAAPIHVAALPGSRLAGGRFAALAGGLHAAPVTIAMDGHDHGLHLELTPADARALLGLPAAALAWEVVDLAEEIGWSRRHLGERFRDELGLSPKVAARVMRFQRACRLLQRPRRPGLADVAAACGYYDQAHLTREWHDLAGCTPTVWMAEELPSVQDAAGGYDAGCAA